MWESRFLIQITEQRLTIAWVVGSQLAMVTERNGSYGCDEPNMPADGS